MFLELHDVLLIPYAIDIVNRKRPEPESKGRMMRNMYINYYKYREYFLDDEIRKMLSDKPAELYRLKSKNYHHICSVYVWRYIMAHKRDVMEIVRKMYLQIRNMVDTRQ